MRRTIETWKSCEPKPMSAMSQTAIYHALNDMRADILELEAMRLEAERQVVELRCLIDRAGFEYVCACEKRDALQANLDTATGLLHEVVTSGRDNWQADAYAFIEKVGINATSTEGKDHA